MIKVFCRVDLLLTLLSIFPSPCANTELFPEKMLQPKTAPREIGGKFLLKSLFQNKKYPPCQILSARIWECRGKRISNFELASAEITFLQFLFVNWMKYWKLFMIKLTPLRLHTLKLMHRVKVPSVFIGWKHFKWLELEKLLRERTVDSERWRTFINQQKIQRCRYWNQLKVFRKLKRVVNRKSSRKKLFCNSALVPWHCFYFFECTCSVNVCTTLHCI